MRSGALIRAEVVEELQWTPGLDESAVRVAVKDGIVTLTGHVPTWADKIKAEAATKAIQGVLGVASDLEVRLPGSYERDDTDIVEAAVAVLRWDAVIPQGKITVTVYGGNLTLEGEVPWRYQRDSAQRAVEGLKGVRSVVNAIEVAPQLDADAIRDRIEAAFRRNAEIDAKNLSINTDGAVVTLSGTVHSWGEREAAEKAAWSAPGVAEVDNQLEMFV